MENKNSGNPSSLMSENKSNNSRVGFFTSPVTLIRLSSILFVFLTIGHTSAYPWTSNNVPQEKQLAGSMKSVDLVFFGERSSYWSLYFGWGLFVAVLLLTLAIILWLLSDIARLAPRRVGVITGIISATCLVGAYFSFRFFYTPPFIMLSVMFVILLTAALQLLRQTYSTAAKQPMNAWV
ncbi:MAG TPA: hypothetical protein VL832_20065 [Puia sp.]|nr:hypothetical protein [Puia sp.]